MRTPARPTVFCDSGAAKTTETRQHQFWIIELWWRLFIWNFDEDSSPPYSKRGLICRLSVSVTFRLTKVQLCSCDKLRAFWASRRSLEGCLSSSCCMPWHCRRRPTSEKICSTRYFISMIPMSCSTFSVIFLAHYTPNHFQSSFLSRTLLTVLDFVCDSGFDACSYPPLTVRQTPSGTFVGTLVVNLTANGSTIFPFRLNRWCSIDVPSESLSIIFHINLLKAFSFFLKTLYINDIRPFRCLISGPKQMWKAQGSTHTKFICKKGRKNFGGPEVGDERDVMWYIRCEGSQLFVRESMIEIFMRIMDGIFVCDPWDTVAAPLALSLSDSPSTDRPHHPSMRLFAKKIIF